MIIPSQHRSVDPYSDNRFSSVINRQTRILTGGENVVVYPDDSFQFSDSTADLEIIISPGVAIKDDVVVHITEDFTMGLNDSQFYEDPTPGIISVGEYYIVLKYRYARSLPSPKAEYKIIRDVESLYHPYTWRYVLLGVFTIGFDDPNFVLENIDYASQEYPDDHRQVISGNLAIVDGGEI